MRPDPIPAIDRLYAWLGEELTDDVASRMRTWWETNPADKQGIHDYNPEQYGIDLDDLRTQFAFYNDRFTVGQPATACRRLTRSKEHSTMDLGLDGAAVVVAGGTTGMGRAAADCFAADGARVAVLARSRRDLDETAAALAALGSPDAVGVAADLFDGASVDAAIAEVGDRWGHVNALVNAAGPMAGGPQELRDLHRSRTGTASSTA